MGAPSRGASIVGGGRAGDVIVNSKHLASWISSISLRYFKGTHTVQLHCMYYTLSLLQTKLAEKSIVSKKSKFYYTVMLLIISI